MSDTPETDASRGYALSSHYGPIKGSYLQMDRSGPFVHAEVARKLERERDEARDMVEKLTEQGLDLMDENRMLKREIKKLKKKYE